MINVVTMTNTLFNSCGFQKVIIKYLLLHILILVSLINSVPAES